MTKCFIKHSLNKSSLKPNVKRQEFQAFHISNLPNISKRQAVVKLAGKKD